MVHKASSRILVPAVYIDVAVTDAGEIWRGSCGEFHQVHCGLQHKLESMYVSRDRWQMCWWHVSAGVGVQLILHCMMFDEDCRLLAACCMFCSVE